jgi:hypothetical protein
VPRGETHVFKTRKAKDFDFWSCSNGLSALPYKQNDLKFLKVFARSSAFLKNRHFKCVLNDKLNTFCFWQILIKRSKGLKSE